jgi:hypothetical protein
VTSDSLVVLPSATIPYLDPFSLIRNNMETPITQKLLITAADELAAAAAELGSHSIQGYEKFIEAREKFIKIANALECSGRLSGLHADIYDNA